MSSRHFCRFTFSLLLLLLTACSGGSGAIRWPFEPSPIEKTSCDESIMKSVKPSRIEGSRKVTFATTDLQFSQPNAQMQTAQLTLQLKGRMALEGLSVDINGLKAASSDGTSYMQIGAGSGSDKTNLVIHLHKLTLSGTSFELFMFKLVANQGILSLILNGRNVQIQSAQLDLRGFIHRDCEPPPPPPPARPKTTLNSIIPSEDTVNVDSIRFAFAADQTGVSFTCELDGVSQPCSSPQTYSGLGNGTHSFQVRATNASGLSDEQPARHQWTIDMVPPEITLVQQPTLTHETSLALQFSTTQNGTTSCSLDGASFKTCVSPVSYVGLSEGTHVIAVVATDALGNTSAPSTFAWTIDQTPPTTTLTKVGPSNSPTAQATLELQFMANETSTFQCQLDQANPAPCQSPFTLNQLAEGAHRLDIQATDLAGNMGALVSYNWIIDQTVPILTLGNVVPAAGVTNSQNLSVEFLTNESSSITCQLDQQSPVACASPYAAVISTEGPHRLTLSAVDLAGNISSPIVLDWQIDFTLPQLSFAQISPSIASFVNATDMQFDLNTSEQMSVQATLDGERVAVTGHSIVVSQLTEGPHTLIVNGQDSAGNQAVPLTHSFTIDRSAPRILAEAQTQNQVTQQASNQIQFSADEAVSWKCQLDQAGFEACNSPVNLAGLADGTHQFEIRATDLAGNMSNSSIPWTVDTQAPTTTLSVLQTDRDAIRLTFSGSEEPALFSCTLDGQDITPCTSPLMLTSLSVGDHAVSVRARDLVGNIDSVGAISHITVLPLIQTHLDAVSPVGSPISQTFIQINFSANHPNATYRCRIDGLPAQVCESPAHFSGLSEGAHLIQIQAIDSFGHADVTGVSVSVTVDTQAPQVEIVPQNIESPSKNAQAQFILQIPGNEQASLNCRLDGSPLPCQTNLVLMNLTDGTHRLEVYAVDLAGNIGLTDSFTWVVDTQAPLTSASLSQTAPDNAVLTFSSNELSSHFRCSVDGAASVLCSSPRTYTGLAEGLHTFWVQAVDPAGNIDPIGVKLSLTVNTCVSPTPMISGLFVTNVTRTSVVVNWQTDVPATSQVVYLNTALNTSQSSPVDSGLVTNHSVTINGLTSNTLYSLTASSSTCGGSSSSNALLVRTSR